MSFDTALPYDNVPSLSPKVEVETKPLLLHALSAARALAELKYADGNDRSQVFDVEAK